MHAVHSFDDDHGLHSIVLSCNELMQLSNQLVAKTQQYLKHFSTTAASDNGNTHNFCLKLLINNFTYSMYSVNTTIHLNIYWQHCAQHNVLVFNLLRG